MNNEKGRVRPADFWPPVIISMLLAGALFFCLKFLCAQQLSTALEKMVDTTVVFSLTFTGFLLTAFTILQVLESKQWFDQMKETQAFKDLVAELRFIIEASIFLFLLSIASMIFVEIISKILWQKLLISILAFFIFLIIIFAWSLIKNIVDLFKA